MPKTPNFDITLLEDALKKTPLERWKEATELYDFYELVSPFQRTHHVKSFNSFKEYEEWKKTIPDPRYW